MCQVHLMTTCGTAAYFNNTCFGKSHFAPSCATNPHLSIVLKTQVKCSRQLVSSPTLSWQIPFRTLTSNLSVSPALCLPSTMVALRKKSIDKYRILQYEIHLGDKDHLGIMVSNAWKHRFMVIKGIVPDSIAQELGIKRNDRIFMVDGLYGETLTLKKLAATLKAKKDYMLTILRKIGFNPLLPRANFDANMSTADENLTQSVHPSIESNGVNLNETYILPSSSSPSITSNLTRHTLQIQQDPSEEEMSINKEEVIEEKSSSWDLTNAWDLTPTCSSVVEYFDRQRVLAANATHPKINKTHSLSLLGDHLQEEVQFECNNMVGLESPFGDQMKRKHLRVANWLSQHSVPQMEGQNFTNQMIPQPMNASFEENKENYAPFEPSSSFWTFKAEFEQLGSGLVKCAHQSDNIHHERPMDPNEKKNRVFANLINLPLISEHPQCKNISPRV